MSGYLRKATGSQSVALGPFISDSDFKTTQTGLTIANTDIKLVVNGGASANKNSGGGTHRVNGVYGVTFDATDSATVGEIEVSVVVSGALPVFDKFYVIEAAVFDALFATSAPGYLQPATAGRTLVVDAAGLADANMVKAGPTGSGTAQTARDIGASVLLSAGTGTGQLDFTSGVVKANLAQILGTALTETSGQLAAAFKKFFNIATPASTMDALTLVATATNLTNAPTSGDLTATMKTSVTTAATAATPTAAAVTGAVGSVTGAVGSVTGAVGSVTARVTANADQLAGQTITAAAGVTFPTSVASPTNITAGTITTVTNLTNAPTVGDLTAAMKTSVTTAATAATPIAASVTGAVGSVTGNVGGNVVGSVASVTAGVTVTTNNDKTGYALSSAGVQAIWDALTSALTTVGSIGKRIADFLTGDAYVRLGAAGAGLTALGDTRIANLDATVSSRLATSGYTAPDNADIASIKAKTDNLPSDPADESLVIAATDAIMTRIGVAGVGLTNLGDTRIAHLDADVSSVGGGSLTVPDIVNGVLDELTSGYQTAGTVGKAITDAQSAGDPMAGTAESGFTYGDVLRLLAAVAMGKDTIVKTGGGTATVTFRSIDDSADRVVGDMVNSRRAAVTLTP